MKAIATVNSAMERLRNLTLTSGAYVNEVNMDMPSFPPRYQVANTRL